MRSVGLSFEREVLRHRSPGPRYFAMGLFRDFLSSPAVHRRRTLCRVAQLCTSAPDRHVELRNYIVLRHHLDGRKFIRLYAHLKKNSGTI